MVQVVTRAGTLSTTGHSTNFVMFVELPSDAPNRTEVEGGAKRVLTDKWIRAGVALFRAPHLGSPSAPCPLLIGRCFAQWPCGIEKRFCRAMKSSCYSS